MSAAENKAVFLSYASQNAEAARRICEALRAAGIQVWFDQNEPLDRLGALSLSNGLVGGDAWDAKIRRAGSEMGVVRAGDFSGKHSDREIGPCLRIRNGILFGK